MLGGIVLNDQPAPASLVITHCGMLKMLAYDDNLLRFRFMPREAPRGEFRLERVDGAEWLFKGRVKRAREADESDLELRIVKREIRHTDDGEERFVMGVVLIPDEVDSQGDIYSADEVRKACHWFMEHGRQIGVQHEMTLSDGQYSILECYLAPTDMEIEGQIVKKGTWILAARVIDDKLWKAIKDQKLTGWSIEGSALAEVLKALRETGEIPETLWN
jgi:hypothetical protein